MGTTTELDTNLPPIRVADIAEQFLDLDTDGNYSYRIWVGLAENRTYTFNLAGNSKWNILSIDLKILANIVGRNGLNLLKVWY